MKRFVMCVVLAVMFLAPKFVGAFEIGARVSSVSLADDHKKEGFVGTITGLDERDGQLVPFVGVPFTRTLSAELALNKLRVHTITSDANGGNVSTDGDYTFTGPQLSVIGRMPNDTPVEPYLGAGVSCLVGDFDPVPSWDRTGDKQRHMEVPTVIAPTVFAGADFKIWESLYADFRVGYEWISADISFSADINGVEVYRKGPYEDVPFGNFTASLAVKLKF